MSKRVVFFIFSAITALTAAIIVYSALKAKRGADSGSEQFEY
jgi:hypothetical protein